MWETKKQLREEAENAESRAVAHFMKLNAIEQILKKEQANKTPAVWIVKKIEDVIYSK